MEKKTYEKPEMQVIDVEPATILAGSTPPPNNFAGTLN